MLIPHQDANYVPVKVPTVILAKVVQVCNWTELCVAQVYCQFLENIPTNVYNVSGGPH